jgi:hypothetical protein
VIGSIVALGICSALLSTVTLAGLQSSSTGDIPISSTPGEWLSLGILLTGTLALVGLELVHATRRHTRLRPVCAVGWRAGDPIWPPEDPS